MKNQFTLAMLLFLLCLFPLSLIAQTPAASMNSPAAKNQLPSAKIDKPLEEPAKKSKSWTNSVIDFFFGSENQRQISEPLRVGPYKDKGPIVTTTTTEIDNMITTETKVSEDQLYIQPKKSEAYVSGTVYISRTTSDYNSMVDYYPYEFHYIGGKPFDLISGPDIIYNYPIYKLKFDIKAEKEIEQITIRTLRKDPDIITPKIIYSKIMPQDPYQLAKANDQLCVSQLTNEQNFDEKEKITKKCIDKSLEDLLYTADQYWGQAEDAAYPFYDGGQIKDICTKKNGTNNHQCKFDTNIHISELYYSSDNYNNFCKYFDYGSNNSTCKKDAQKTFSTFYDLTFEDMCYYSPYTDTNQKEKCSNQHKGFEVRIQFADGSQTSLFLHPANSFYWQSDNSLTHPFGQQPKNKPAITEYQLYIPASTYNQTTGVNTEDGIAQMKAIWMTGPCDCPDEDWSKYHCTYHNPPLLSIPGCCAEDSDCNDNNACTNDSCNASQKCVHTKINFDDKNPCTQDTCNPKTGVVTHKALSNISCDDGNECTKNDTCKNGKCLGDNDISCYGDGVPEVQPDSAGDGIIIPNPGTEDSNEGRKVKPGIITDAKIDITQPNLSLIPTNTGDDAGDKGATRTPNQEENCPALVRDCSKEDLKIDSDHDGRPDCMDNCPTLSNPMQEDRDEDGVGDACDNCRRVFNPDQSDRNNDDIGDACEPTCR